jgi:hypothetical protein
MNEFWARYLVEKLPVFDPGWSQPLQDKWLEYCKSLLDYCQVLERSKPRYWEYP